MTKFQAVVFALVLVVCACGLTTQQKVQVGEAIVDTACETLSAYAPSGTQEKICATASEVQLIADYVMAQHLSASDGGVRAAKLDSCMLVPGAGVCATNAELSKAIMLVKAHRILSADAGHE